MNADGCLWLTLEATAGNTPEGVAQEMAQVSARLNIPIKVDFNGFQLLAFPGDNKEAITHQWTRRLNALKSKRA